MTKRREVNESPIYQAPDESIAYSIDFVDWGTPTSPTITLYSVSGGVYTDVSIGNLSGAASVTNDIVTTKTVHTLAGGSEYLLVCAVAIDGNTMSCKVKIICEAK